MSEKLYFYHSVMNSGKSANLILQVHNLQSQGKKVLVLKPKLDTRDNGVIKSRALETFLEAHLIDDDTDIIDLVSMNYPDYVFVDEVNFLSPKHIDALAKLADDLLVPVFGYGLMVDYRGKLFEGSKRMVELADSIRELKSPCVHCSRKATMHLRKVNGGYVFDGESIQVGDIDTYESVCRKCYYDKKRKSTIHIQIQDSFEQARKDYHTRLKEEINESYK